MGAEWLGDAWLAGLAWLLQFAYVHDWYLIILLPGLGGFALGGLLYALVGRTHCRNPWLAGTLGYEAMPLLAGAGLALLVPALLLTALAGRMNLLALGDEGAAALGVDVARTRFLAFFAASAAVGVAVAFTGLVGFVGLVVPHAVRLVAGPDHRVVLPASALGGAAFLVLADALARLLFRGLGAEPPVGAVTALIGAPLFVVLLRSRR